MKKCTLIHFIMNKGLPFYNKSVLGTYFIYYYPYYLFIILFSECPCFWSSYSCSCSRSFAQVCRRQSSISTLSMGLRELCRFRCCAFRRDARWINCCTLAWPVRHLSCSSFALLASPPPPLPPHAKERDRGSGTSALHECALVVVWLMSLTAIC